MYTRKDFLDLTSEERDRLADALNELFDGGQITLYADVHEAVVPSQVAPSLAHDEERRGLLPAFVAAMPENQSDAS